MAIVYQIPSEAQIRKELKHIVFGKFVFCPRCGSRNIKKYERRWRCRICRNPFSLTSVTWLKGMKTSLETFYKLLWCYTQKIPSDQAMKFAEVSRVTSRHWYDTFRLRIPQEPLDAIRLSGVVQMDECYRGGKKRGYSIVGAKQKSIEGERKRVVMKIVRKPSVDRGDIMRVIPYHVVPNSCLNTDGAFIYKGIENWWPLTHKAERHNRWEFELTSEIEGEWATLGNFTRRMYHHVTRIAIESVVREFVARQVFPEWFETPSTFLETSLWEIVRPTPKGRRTIAKIPKKKHAFNSPDFPFVSLPKYLSTVPCCL